MMTCNTVAFSLLTTSTNQSPKHGRRANLWYFLFGCWKLGISPKKAQFQGKSWSADSEQVSSCTTFSCPLFTCILLTNMLSCTFPPSSPRTFWAWFSHQRCIWNWPNCPPFGQRTETKWQPITCHLDDAHVWCHAQYAKTRYQNAAGDLTRFGKATHPIPSESWILSHHGAGHHFCLEGNIRECHDTQCSGCLGSSVWPAQWRNHKEYPCQQPKLTKRGRRRNLTHSILHGFTHYKHRPHIPMKFQCQRCVIVSIL